MANLFRSDDRRFDLSVRFAHAFRYVHAIWFELPFDLICRSMWLVGRLFLWTAATTTTSPNSSGHLNRFRYRWIRSVNRLPLILCPQKEPLIMKIWYRLHSIRLSLVHSLKITLLLLFSFFLFFELLTFYWSVPFFEIKWILNSIKRLIKWK